MTNNEHDDDYPMPDNVFWATDYPIYTKTIKIEPFENHIKYNNTNSYSSYISPAIEPDSSPVIDTNALYGLKLDSTTQLAAVEPESQPEPAQPVEEKKQSKGSWQSPSQKIDSIIGKFPDLYFNIPFLSPVYIDDILNALKNNPIIKDKLIFNQSQIREFQTGSKSAHLNLFTISPHQNEFLYVIELSYSDIPKSPSVSYNGFYRLNEKLSNLSKVDEKEFKSILNIKGSIKILLEKH